MSPRISISLLAAQSDQRLLALARAGNERAFEALVQRYRRPLLRYCRRMRLSDTRAEDVVQQAFLRAWMALARGGEVRELRPWLYRITHNAAVNAMRGQAESHGELTDAAQARAALSHESNLERTIAVREALGEVAELPRMQRQAIFLTAVDGQTHDEVASTLGISHGALRGLLYRARATLRDAAAALTPPPLLSWASRGAGAATPTAERVADLTAGGSAVGVAGVLLKGAVVAVTAGALATGASVIASDQRGGTSLHRDASSRAIATPSAAPPAGKSGRPAGAGEPLLDGLGADRAGGERGGGHRAHRRGRALARARHGARHARGGDPHDGGDPAERDAAARGERSPGGDEDSLGGGRGEDGGDDDGGSTSATGGRQGAARRGHGKSPSTGSDPPGRSGSGGGSDADTTPGVQAQGGSGGDESNGSDVSGDDRSGSSRSGGANGAEAELAAASGVDSTSTAGSLGGENASDGERSGGGSGEASGHAGAGADG
jgi:RNA polymerase sigma factor (sigma-70 family)